MIAVITQVSWLLAKARRWRHPFQCLYMLRSVHAEITLFPLHRRLVWHKFSAIHYLFRKLLLYISHVERRAIGQLLGRYIRRNRPISPHTMRRRRWLTKWLLLMAYCTVGIITAEQGVSGLRVLYLLARAKYRPWRVGMRIWLHSHTRIWIWAKVLRWVIWRSHPRLLMPWRSQRRKSWNLWGISGS